jgi:hypothetical protein
VETGDDSLPYALVKCKTPKQIQARELENKVYEVHIGFFDTKQAHVYKKLRGLHIQLMYESFKEKGSRHVPLILPLTDGVVGIPDVIVIEMTSAGVLGITGARVRDIMETVVMQTPMPEVTEAVETGVTGIPEPGVTRVPEVIVQSSDGVTRSPVATQLGDSSKNPTKKNKGKAKKRIDDAVLRRADYATTPVNMELMSLLGHFL